MTKTNVRSHYRNGNKVRSYQQQRTLGSRFGEALRADYPGNRKRALTSACAIALAIGTFALLTTTMEIGYAAVTTITAGATLALGLETKRRRGTKPKVRSFHNTMHYYRATVSRALTNGVADQVRHKRDQWQRKHKTLNSWWLAYGAKYEMKAWQTTGPKGNRRRVERTAVVRGKRNVAEYERKAKAAKGWNFSVKEVKW